MKKNPDSQLKRLVQSVLMTLALTIAATPAASAADASKNSPVIERNLSLKNEINEAIDKGAHWLAKNQDAKGFWSTGDHAAVTALALMALKGRTESEGAKTDPAVMQRGYDFLLHCAQPDGSIYSKKQALNYNTAVSLMAFLAADRSEYKPVILKARDFLIGMQIDLDDPGKADSVFDGGVGYGSRYQHSDLANTMQALEALYHSKQLVQDQNLAGAKDLNWGAAIQFIQNCQNLPSHNKQSWVSDDPKDAGGFVYYPGSSMAGETNLPSGRTALRSYGSISYAGMLSYIYANLKQDDPRVAAVAEWLRKNYTLDENPGMGPAGIYYYYHTMTKALTLSGKDQIELADGKKVNWREQLALKLINLQKGDGSWQNDNGRWMEKDPALVTAYAMISLEMIHRGI